MADDPDRKRSAGPLPGRADDQVTLPYAKAFVVHFAAETNARLEHVIGRVEHLQTGCRSRFASIEGLLACIRTALAEADKPTEGGASDV
jgi:hypothetical protein